MKTIGILILSVALAMTTFGQEAPVLLVPDVAATMDNGCRDRSNGIVWDFFWVPVAGAREYHLWVKRDAAAKAWIEATQRSQLIYSAFPELSSARLDRPTGRGEFVPGSDRNGPNGVRSENFKLSLSMRTVQNDDSDFVRN